jgi:hypothetical protein
MKSFCVLEAFDLGRGDASVSSRPELFPKMTHPFAKNGDSLKAIASCRVHDHGIRSGLVTFLMDKGNSLFLSLL